MRLIHADANVFPKNKKPNGLITRRRRSNGYLQYYVEYVGESEATKVPYGHAAPRGPRREYCLICSGDGTRGGRYCEFQGGRPEPVVRRPIVIRRTSIGEVPDFAAVIKDNLGQGESENGVVVFDEKKDDDTERDRPKPKPTTGVMKREPKAVKGLISQSANGGIGWYDDREETMEWQAAAGTPKIASDATIEDKEMADLVRLGVIRGGGDEGIADIAMSCLPAVEVPYTVSLTFGGGRQRRGSRRQGKVKKVRGVGLDLDWWAATETSSASDGEKGKGEEDQFEWIMSGWSEVSSFVDVTGSAGE